MKLNQISNDGEKKVIDIEFVKANSFLGGFCAASDIAGDKGHILSLPEVVKLKIDNPECAEIWRHAVDTNSEEIICKDKEGVFGEKGEWLYLMIHGAGLFTPRKKEDYVSSSKKVPDSAVTSLLSGKAPFISRIIIYRGPNEPNSPYLPQTYGIAMSLADVSYFIKNQSGQDIKSLSHNPIFIARVGGYNAAINYLDTLREVYGKVSMRNQVYLIKGVAEKSFITENMNFNTASTNQGGSWNYLVCCPQQATDVQSPVVLDTIAPTPIVAASVPALETLMGDLDQFILPKDRKEVSTVLSKYFK